MTLAAGGRHSPRGPGGGLARGEVVEATLPRTAHRIAHGDRPDVDPVLCLGQPGPIGNDGMDAPRPLSAS